MLVKEEKNSGKRYIMWIDVVRGIAIMAVVLCHSTEAIYLFNNDFVSLLSNESKVFLFMAETIGRLGVPLFMMITGYLLLDRNYEEKYIWYFWKHNLLRLFIVIEFWIILYNIFLIYFHQSKIELPDILKDMLFLGNVDMSHTWYLSTILGLYLFVPLVAIVLNNFNKKVLLIPMTIAIVYLFVVPIVNVIFQNEIWNNLELSWSGGIYGTLLIIGYFMKQRVLSNVKRIYLLMIGIIAYISTVVLQYGLWQRSIEYFLWYNCIFLIVTAICIFELCARLEKINLFNIWKNLAKCSFGIYLVHNIIKEYVVMWVEKLGVILPIQVFLVFITTFLISWGIVQIFSKTFKFARILFYMSEK